MFYLSSQTAWTNLRGDTRMTRKDYVMIADTIATSWHASADSKADIAYKFADVLEADNPRFDRHRFLVACGVN